MRCLWLTLADPDPPMNGQFLYSSGLIHAVAATGTELHVVGFGPPGGVHRDGERSDGICWHLAEHRPLSRWRTLVSLLPKGVARTRTRGLLRLVRAQLAAGPWDAVVFDSWALGWALPLLHACPAARIYLAHNHEEDAARAMARGEHRPLRRILKQIDGVKAARLERSLSRHAALLTADTPEDCARFREFRPAGPIEFVPPGYGGERLAARRITAAIPRRAVIVGTFDWAAKRQSLEDFLAAADPLFARAGIELQVVGQAEPAFLRRLARNAQATRFTGRVGDVARYMRQARIALVPDQLGGFKLKGLDYVFNRLPIFAMAGSLPGMPLRHGESAMFYESPAALAAGVIALIEDFPRLDQLHEAAYRACRGRFDWREIGRQLVAAIQAERVQAAAPSLAPASQMAGF